MGLSSTPIRRRSNEPYQEMMEKRQLFLRSYQFSRKRSLMEMIKRSLTGAKRVFWFRLRSTHKINKLVWSRLRFLILYRRKRRFIHLFNSHNNHTCFGCS